MLLHLILFKEEMKAKMVEKEQEVKLMIDSATASELELIKKKHKSLLDENNELSVKVSRSKFLPFLLFSTSFQWERNKLRFLEEMYTSVQRNNWSTISLQKIVA